MSKFAASVFIFCFATRLYIAIFGFIAVFYWMRCIGVSSFHPLSPFISFLIGGTVYFENIFTDTQEDSANRRNAFRFLPNPDLLRFLRKGHFLFYFVALLFSLFIGRSCFFWTATAIIVSLSYANRWLPNFKGRGVRPKDIFILKNIIPGIAWVIVIAVIPFVSSGVQIIPPYIFLFVLIFLLEVREEIKFDIPDVDGDLEVGIRTFPGVWGEHATKRLLYFINGILGLSFFVMLLALYESRQPMLDVFLKNGFPFLITIARDPIHIDFLFKTKKKDYLNAGILWGVMLLVIFLLLPFPYNIFVYLILCYEGCFLKFCHLLVAINSKIGVPVLDLSY